MSSSANIAELWPNFVDGERRSAAASETLEVVNPSTGRTIARVAVSGPDDVDAAVRAAKSALPAWSNESPATRAGLLNKLADVLQAHFDELAELEASNAGKPISATREELEGVIDSVRLFAMTARSLPGFAAGEYLSDNTSMLRREPLGVVGAITPWNYPLLQATAKVVPALAVGNTVVLKPAEATPISTLRLAELAATVLPKGVFNVVTGTGPLTGNAITTHPDIAAVSFTGSVAGGRAVASAAALTPKKAIMELGGNAPAVVFADADLADAAKVLAVGGLYNTGQECMASSRILVERSAIDEFVALLAKEVSGVKIGDTMDPDTELGPMITERQLTRLEALVDRRPPHAQVITGAQRIERDGYFYEPTIITGVTQDDELVQEEIFGPVFTVQAFDGDEEGLALANGTRYGLAASVWTADVTRAMRFSKEMTSGTVWVNNHLAFGPDLPVSGWGESGYGVENSLLGLVELTRIKHVAVNIAASEGQ